MTDQTKTTVCRCLGGSTHATPEGRVCDLCGGIVHDQPAPPTTADRRDYRQEYDALAHALVGETGLSAITEAGKHARPCAPLPLRSNRFLSHRRGRPARKTTGAFCNGSTTAIRMSRRSLSTWNSEVQKFMNEIPTTEAEMTAQAAWMPGRFTGAGPWPSGEYYVWDKRRSAICNPDTGGYETPYRLLATPEEAEAAAGALNKAHLQSIDVWGGGECFVAYYGGMLLASGETEASARSEAERLWNAGVYDYAAAFEARIAAL